MSIFVVTKWGWPICSEIIIIKVNMFKLGITAICAAALFGEAEARRRRRRRGGRGGGGNLNVSYAHAYSEAADAADTQFGGVLLKENLNSTSGTVKVIGKFSGLTDTSYTLGIKQAADLAYTQLGTKSFAASTRKPNNTTSRGGVFDSATGTLTNFVGQEICLLGSTGASTTTCGTVVAGKNATTSLRKLIFCGENPTNAKCTATPAPTPDPLGPVAGNLTSSPAGLGRGGRGRGGRGRGRGRGRGLHQRREQMRERRHQRQERRQERRHEMFDQN